MLKSNASEIIFPKEKKEKKKALKIEKHIKREWKEAWLTESAIVSLNLLHFFLLLKILLLG